MFEIFDLLFEFYTEQVNHQALNVLRLVSKLINRQTPINRQFISLQPSRGKYEYENVNKIRVALHKYIKASRVCISIRMHVVFTIYQTIVFKT